MKIISDSIPLDELRVMAEAIFGNMVKAVVDVDKELVAFDAELHSDLEAALLEKGALQKSLWGINIYPDMQGDDFIEFDSMINMRPSQGNKSRGIESEQMRQRIVQVVVKRVKR